MESEDFVWVLAAVFSGLSSYLFGKNQTRRGQDAKPLFDDLIPLQDTAKARQINQLKHQLEKEQENLIQLELKYKKEIEYLNAQITRLRTTEKQDDVTDQLMKEMDQEITETELLTDFDVEPQNPDTDQLEAEINEMIQSLRHRIRNFRFNF